MRISDWSSDVCSSDLHDPHQRAIAAADVGHPRAGERQALAQQRGVLDQGQGIHGGRILARISQTIVGLCLTPAGRSEEHTSELQSLMRISYAVFCLKKHKKASESTSHFIIIYET